jgi:predicted Zn-dependent protease
MKTVFRGLIALLVCGAFTNSYALDFGQQLRDKLKEQLPDQIKARVSDVADALGKTSQNDEIAIGRQISGNLLGAAPLVNDVELQRYVNRVGRWVANQSERADLPWHFGVIESSDVNAFAAPGEIGRAHV